MVSYGHVITSLLVLFYALGLINCDLYLFKRNELNGHLNQHNVDNLNEDDSYDKLHLFPHSKLCSEQFDPSSEKSALQIEKFCKLYCFNNQVNESEKSNNKEETGVQDSGGGGSGPIINLSGVLHYYKSFVFVLLERINGQLKHVDGSEDHISLSMNIQLSGHEYLKLRALASARSDDEALRSIQDATDILKTMIVEMRENKVLGWMEQWLWFIRAHLLDHVWYLSYFCTALAIGVSFFVLPKMGFFVRVEWRKMLLFLSLMFFVFSVINNHHYLSQKKQIYKQQKLKEDVPDECKSDISGNKDSKSSSSSMSKLFRFVRYSLGFSATSRRCLEYHEALYLTSNQHNYMESVVYTFSESLRPIAVGFGESINQFYSAITKDLGFWQYIPLLIGVTVVMVVLIIFGTAFLSLLLFNYELNFFHLIKFRKSSEVVAQESLQENEKMKKMLEQKKTEMLEILHDLKKENRALNAHQQRKKKHESIEMTSHQAGPLQMMKPINGTQPTFSSSSSSIQASTIDSSILVKNIESKSERIYALDPAMDASDALLNAFDEDEDVCVGEGNTKNNNNVVDLNAAELSDREVDKDEDLNESLRKNLEMYKEKHVKKDKYYNRKINELKQENMKLKNKVSEIESHMIMEKQIELDNLAHLSHESSGSQSGEQMGASMKPNNYNNHHLAFSTSSTAAANTQSAVYQVKNLNHHHHNHHNHNRHHDSDDEENDIYVILDEQ